MVQPLLLVQHGFHQDACRPSLHRSLKLGDPVAPWKSLPGPRASVARVWKTFLYLTWKCHLSGVLWRMGPRVHYLQKLQTSISSLGEKSVLFHSQELYPSSHSMAPFPSIVCSILQDKGESQEGRWPADSFFFRPCGKGAQRLGYLLER